MSNLLPEFIGVLLIALVVWHFSDIADHGRYVAALRAVRTSLRKAKTEGKLKQEDLQGMMKEVVSATSELYFHTRRPPVPAKDRSYSCPSAKCGTCEAFCPIINGACGTCHDVMAAWIGERES